MTFDPVVLEGNRDFYTLIMTKGMVMTPRELAEEGNCLPECHLEDR